MKGEMSESAIVLIVDDEPELATVYARWLEDDHRVQTASPGEEALDQLSQEPDVVLLDREMPKMSGPEILSCIREHGLDCRVAMVTGVSPDFDIIDLDVDDYLVKPVSKAQLQTAVQRLLTLSTYNKQAQEFFALVAKSVRLESEKNPAELEASDEYSALKSRLIELRNNLDNLLTELDTEQVCSLYRDIGPKRIESAGESRQNHPMSFVDGSPESSEGEGR